MLANDFVTVPIDKRLVAAARELSVAPETVIAKAIDEYIDRLKGGEADKPN